MRDGKEMINTEITPGKCDLCGEYKERTVKGLPTMIRVCSDCGRLDTIIQVDNKRVRSTKEEIEERSKRVNSHRWNRWKTA